MSIFLEIPILSGSACLILNSDSVLASDRKGSTFAAASEDEIFNF